MAALDYSLAPQPVQPGAELFLRATRAPQDLCGLPSFSGAAVAGSTLRVHVYFSDALECGVALTKSFSLGILPAGVTQVAIYQCADFAPPGVDPCSQQPARVFDLTQQGVAVSLPAVSPYGVGLLVAAIVVALVVCRARG